ncbi:MAG: 4Fe-4S dicluster domain-containing protein [Magnetococcales bacterium]|nr:4Fe-4S dicluster domain-containing protein [Magnetococcales bacterium]
MHAFLVPIQDVITWIRRLGGERSVYFPQQVGRESYRFLPVKSDSAIEFHGYRPTLAPPGKKLSPATDTLFFFRNRDSGHPELHPVLDCDERVLAGVRPCDLKGIELMDRVNREGHADPHHLTRRAHTTLIGCDCLAPCDERCFCDAAGSLTWRDNADLFFTPLAEEVLLEVFSDVGAALLHGCDFSPCVDPDAVKTRIEQSRARPFGRQWPTEAITGSGLSAEGAAWIWEKHVAACFSCGSCNLVCPTCYCFDVHDTLDLPDFQSGQRIRTADGCMLPTFAQVAGGHDFRPTPASRQKHRVKRKFAYLNDRFDTASFCTGCGRCGRQCTAGIDIFDIVSDLIDHAEASR